MEVLNNRELLGGALKKQALVIVHKEEDGS